MIFLSWKEKLLLEGGLTCARNGSGTYRALSDLGYRVSLTGYDIVFRNYGKMMANYPPFASPLVFFIAWHGHIRNKNSRSRIEAQRNLGVLCCTFESRSGSNEKIVFFLPVLYSVCCTEIFLGMISLEEYVITNLKNIVQYVIEEGFGHVLKMDLVPCCVCRSSGVRTFP